VSLTIRSHYPYGRPPVRTKYEAELEDVEVQNKVHPRTGHEGPEGK